MDKELSQLALKEGRNTIRDNAILHGETVDEGDARQLDLGGRLEAVPQTFCRGRRYPVGDKKKKKIPSY